MLSLCPESMLTVRSSRVAAELSPTALGQATDREPVRWAHNKPTAVRANHSGHHSSHIIEKPVAPLGCNVRKGLMASSPGGNKEKID